VSRILLVRSSETALSARSRFAGRSDAPLDQRGIDLASRVAARLAPNAPTAVWTSPLLRARQTSETIAAHLGLSAIAHDGLTDVDLGAWTGLSLDEMRARDPAVFDWFFRLPRAATPPGGELLMGAERRVLRALNDIGRGDPAGTAIAVTHELPIRLVLVRLRGLEGTALWDPIVAPGSVTELVWTRDGLELPTPLERLFRIARDRNAALWRGPG
jgi:broad specificity phosphatase PhoE